MPNTADTFPQRNERARTFLFTDVVGSTALWERPGSVMGQALALHDRLLAQTFGDEGGAIVKHTGDGFMVQFSSPRAAVDAAVKAHLALADAAWPEGAVIGVRIGLHHGEAEERGGDWFGTTVNTAARVMGAAHGGQVLVSSTVVDALGSDGFVDLGSHRFKGLSSPLRIFHVDAVGLTPVDQQPPPAALPTRVVVLPATEGELIGRDGDVERVRSMLAERSWVTVTGPAGIGKTRLALEVARNELPDRTDGAVFVALGRPSVVDAVADALGLARAPETPEALAAIVAERDLLLVLDGADRRIDDVRALVQAVPDGSACGIVVTSGVRLGLDAERVHAVGPLVAGALTLLRSALNELPGGSTVDDGEVAAVCDLLDGNPLALELAARRINEIGVTACIEELDPDGTGSADVDAIIDRTLDVLDPDQRRALDAASQFDTTFSSHALAAMLDRPVASTRGQLAGLSALSLVHRTDGRDEHRLATTVRGSRRRALFGSGDGAMWAESHARLVCASVVGHAPALRGRDERATREAMRPFLPELRRAAVYLFALDPATVWATFAALAPYESIWLFEVGRLAADLVARAPVDEVPPIVLAQAASAWSVRANLAEAERLGRIGVARSDGTSGHPWSVLANALLTAGQVEEATELIGAGVAVASATGDALDLALSASGQSIFAFWASDDSLAVDAGRLALEAAESNGSETALASAAGALGTALVRTDPDQARELLELGVDVAVDIGNGAHELIARRGLGLLGRTQKNWGLAFPSLVGAMTRADELGEELEYRIAADLLINCASRAGHNDVALMLRQSLGEAELLSSPRTEELAATAKDALDAVDRIRISSRAGRLPRRDLIAWLRGELEERTPAAS